MTTRTLLFAFILIANMSWGQVQISSDAYFKYNLEPVAKEVFEGLKKIKTNFIHFSSSEGEASKLKQELQKVWTYNELVMVHYDDYTKGNYDKSNARFDPTKAIGSGGDILAYVLIAPIDGANRTVGFFILQEPEIIGKTINYGPAINWSTPYLKASLKRFNDMLKSQTSATIHTELVTPEVTKIKDKTLLIPQEMTNEIAIKSLKKYTFPYEVLPMDQLEEKVKSNPDQYYVFSNVRYGTTNITSVFNPQTNDYIYIKKSPLMRLNVIFGKSELSKLIKSIKTGV